MQHTLHKLLSVEGGIMKVLLILLTCVSFCFAEVPVRYDGKLCKMEIITSESIKNRYASEIVKKQVLDFCKDKYLYNVEVTDFNGKQIYIIFYNDKGE